MIITHIIYIYMMFWPSWLLWHVLSPSPTHKILVPPPKVMIVEMMAVVVTMGGSGGGGDNLGKMVSVHDFLRDSSTEVFCVYI